MSAYLEILEERTRQIEKLGYTIERDIGYYNNELINAAFCYWAKALNLYFNEDDSGIASIWPWDISTFYFLDRRRCFIKAGALYLAEIDRRISLDGDTGPIYLNVLKLIEHIEKYDQEHGQQDES